MDAKQHSFGVPTFAIAAPDSGAHFNYGGFHPSSTTLPKGFVKRDGVRPLPEPLIFDRDVAIAVRDGVKLYGDIFRAKKHEGEKLPALLPWSPYGKSGNGLYQYAMMGPYHCGIAPSRLSGFEKFEGPDPAEWCGRGYAIVNVDARGAFDSEGDHQWWGVQEAEDIYDVCEWIAKQPWCNGSVGMIGNSWLSVSQVNIASRGPPPSLKCVAPWEGFNDVYRDIVGRGGVPTTPFFGVLQLGCAGHGKAVDVVKAMQQRPLYDDFWRTMSQDPRRIPAGLPVYMLASYSSGLHTLGSVDSYRHSPARNKWLRFHPYQEWYDLYRPENVSELDRYYSRYLKGIDNGFERDTPAVRISLLGFGTVPDVVERPETSYPIERQRLQTFYLDASSMTGSPSTSAPKKAATTSYDAHHLTDLVEFNITFDKPTELAGLPMVELYVSCAEHDDLDVHVIIRKKDANGKLLVHLNYPCPDPVEKVTSINVVNYDAARSTENEPYYAHDRREAVEKGKIIRLSIPVWPIGMVFGPGESAVVQVSGRVMIEPELEMIVPKEPYDENVGRHVIHTGGEYPSRVSLPIIKG